MASLPRRSCAQSFQISAPPRVDSAEASNVRARPAGPLTSLKHQMLTRRAHNDQRSEHVLYWSRPNRRLILTMLLASVSIAQLCRAVVTAAKADCQTRTQNPQTVKVFTTPLMMCREHTIAIYRWQCPCMCRIGGIWELLAEVCIPVCMSRYALVCVSGGGGRNPPLYDHWPQLLLGIPKSQRHELWK